MDATQAASRTFSRSDLIILGSSALAVALSGWAHYTGADGGLTFALAAVGIAALASLVGRSVEQLGDRFGPGATGVLQSALGNLPELFICLFALKNGLVGVVQAALIGSILANLLLVMGLAFVVGGLKHGTQAIDSERARTISVLLLVSLVAMVLPSLTKVVHTPAGSHEHALSLLASVVLLLLFALTLPASLKRQNSTGLVDVAGDTRVGAACEAGPMADDTSSVYAAEDLLAGWLDEASRQPGRPLRITVGSQVVELEPEPEPRFTDPGRVQDYVDRVLAHLVSTGSRYDDGDGLDLASVPVVVAAGLAFRQPLRLPRPTVGITLASGVLDMSANVLFLLATREGLLTIVSVVAALYPVSTVALAFAIDRERVTRSQAAGMAMAVAALAMVSLG